MYGALYFAQMAASAPHMCSFPFICRTALRPCTRPAAPSRSRRPRLRAMNSPPARRAVRPNSGRVCGSHLLGGQAVLALYAHRAVAAARHGRAHKYEAGRVRGIAAHRVLEQALQLGAVFRPRALLRALPLQQPLLHRAGILLGRLLRRFGQFAFGNQRVNRRVPWRLFRLGS